jgi:tRNA pseudouridine55 synthase
VPTTSAAEGPSGLAVVDKPAGWTSHDVVARGRRLLGTKKVGHSGTLDPGATGVLLLGVGRVTRLLRFLGDLPKSYECEVVLGIETSTLDDDGEVTATHDMSGVTFADVAAAAGRFVGDIEQVPPMVSAIQIGGKRLHELARQGIEVERPARPVTVHRLDVEPTDEPLVVRLSVTCSSGTYVRTIAADLGAALGGGAHLRRLRRTAIGPHDLSVAVALDDLTPERLLPPIAAVAHLDRWEVDEAGRELVRTGRLPEARPPTGGPWALVGPGEELLGVAEHVGGRVKPAVVIVQ